jgi:hypothetical protein
MGLGLIFSLCAMALATTSSSAQESLPLPRNQILQAYKGGELDSVLLFIRGGRSKPLFKDRADSILAFKCLGVIYASDPVRREKGRYYFNMLLRVDPMASITDFYPSETIRTVFREVREEFMELHPELLVTMKAVGEIPEMPKADSTKVESPKPVPVLKQHQSNSKTVWWLAGGTAVAVGAGTATYFMLAGDNSPKVYRIHD